jgi:hypothetical protein
LRATGLGSARRRDADPFREISGFAAKAATQLAQLARRQSLGPTEERLMNRNLLVLVGLAGALSVVFAAGCGDDTSDSGGGPAGGGEAPQGAGGGGPEGGGTPQGVTCASYCADISANCSAANQQWPNAGDCEEACAAFEQGDAGDQTDDTLECRAYHAGVAGTTEPQVHCIHAGPLGSGVDAGNGCGTDRCLAFCRVGFEICGTDPGYPFDSEDDCRTDCAAYTDDVDFTTNQTSGDTLACRMYHLTAAIGDKATHCPHLAGSQCTD